MRQEDTSERRIQEAGAAGAKASSRGWDSEGLFRRHHDPSMPGPVQGEGDMASAKQATSLHEVAVQLGSLWLVFRS